MRPIPAASATPDGNVRVNILISCRMEEEAEVAEIIHRDDLIEKVSEQGFYRLQARGAESSIEGISLRRAARMEHIEVRREARRLADRARRANGRPGRRH